jgi:hypothetical protein
MWRIGQAPNNPSKWQMGFNSAFKGLIKVQILLRGYSVLRVTERAMF